MKFAPRFIIFLLVIHQIAWLSGQNSSEQAQRENEILAGISSKDITPDLSVRNWVTGESFDTLLDPIFARALVLKDEKNISVIISWELVDAGESATAALRSRIHQKLGIPRENVLLNATHNHSAPWSPIYKKGLRGAEKETWWALRHMPSQSDSSAYIAWTEKLINQSVMAVETALDNLTLCTVWLGRTDISEVVRNRRPRSPSWGIVESSLPEKFNYKHEDWDPKVLGAGMNFGDLDRSLSLLSFRDSTGQAVASIFHMAAHAVAIYPFHTGISGDWPGATTRKVNSTLGGQSLFLQGTAGDVNPSKRGIKAVEAMASQLSRQIKKAYDYSSQLKVEPLICSNTWVGLPLTQYGRESTGLKAIDAELQMISIGPLAIISLPGEPMTGIGKAIRHRSPFPQTLVLGYSNGKGSFYVGLPGEKEKGGYESGEKTSIGTDAAGQILIETAAQLLHENFGKN